MRGDGLPLLETVKNQLHPAGDSQFFEDPEEVIPNDSGSTLLGISLAFLSLDFWRANPASNPSLPFPLLIAAVPLLDAVLAVARRLRNLRSPLCGDRRHFYDLLLAGRLPPRRVALASYSLTAGLVVLGWRSLSLRPGVAVAVCVLAYGLLVSASLWLGVLRRSEAVSKGQGRNSGFAEQKQFAAVRRSNVLPG